MDAIAGYFAAERAESLLFIAVGLIALAIAAEGVWRTRTPWRRGMAVPLALVAAIQIAVGTTIWLRSPQDTARVQALLRSDPARMNAEEVPRMQAVMRNFEVYRSVEIVLLAAGLGLVLFTRRGSAWQGAGLGLAVQSAFMLVLDAFAEQRGAAYLAFVSAA